MEFLEFTKKLLKIKKEYNKENYSTNPFKENKQVTFIWIDTTKDKD